MKVTQCDGCEKVIPHTKPYYHIDMVHESANRTGAQHLVRIPAISGDYCDVPCIQSAADRKAYSVAPGRIVFSTEEVKHVGG